MKKQIKRVFLLGGLLLALTGCGDDVNVSVSAIGNQDLTEYISQEESEEGMQESGEAGLGADTGTGETQTPGQENGTVESTEANTQEDVVTVTISAAGDVTLGTHQAQDYANSFRQAYDQAEDEGYFFQNVRHIFEEDDMTLVNLEGVLTFSENMAPDRTFNIKGDPDYAYLLNAGNIEAVSMANNHRLDFGEEGTKDTVEALEKAGITYAYDNIVGIYETKGIRIGYVSVNEVAWGQGVEKLLQDGFQKLQEEEVDLTIACCHWGIERENYPEDYQRELGKKCIDWGADMVIGHHPHVLEGIEEYQGKYIVYSLANFCFGANRNPSDKDTVIFQQTFTFRDGVKEEETTAKIIPCSVSSVTNRNDFCPTPLEGEDAKRVLDRMREYSRDFGVDFDEEGNIR